MAVDIRPFEQRDEDAVVALWQACGLVRPWNDPRRDIARKLTVQPDLFLVATDADTIVGAGMAGYDGHRGWVNYLAVAPGLRQLGIGRALMQAFERELLALGCPKVNLQVRAGNDDVLAFYARLGYSDDNVVSLGKRLIPDT
jgi:ribosomal protein S18 acetylase RimI-like enzyme